MRAPQPTIEPTAERDCALCADSSVANCNNDNAVFAHTAVVALQQVGFNGNTCTGRFGGVLTLANATSVVLNTTLGFGTTDGADLLLERPSSRLYTSLAHDPTVKTNQASQGPVRPLGAAPATIDFPSAIDAAFTSLQQVRLCIYIHASRELLCPCSMGHMGRRAS